MPIYGARMVSPGTCEMQREGRAIEARRVCVAEGHFPGATSARCVPALEDSGVPESCRTHDRGGRVFCCPQAVAQGVQAPPPADVSALWAEWGAPMTLPGQQQQQQDGKQDSGGGFFGWLTGKNGGQQAQDVGKQIDSVINNEVSQVAGTLDVEPGTRVETASMFSSALPWVFGAAGVLLVGGVIVGVIVRRDG